MQKIRKQHRRKPILPGDEPYARISWEENPPINGFYEMMMLFVDKGEAEVVTYAAQFMRIANYFYPCLGLLTILRYSIQGLGYSNLSMLSGVMEMIARCGVSLWLVPALAWTGVCFGDPVAWVMADLFLIPAFLWLYKHLKKEQTHTP